MFGHMQEGVAKVYDPARFASLLGIDNGIQQDPQVHILYSSCSCTVAVMLLLLLLQLFMLL